MNSQEQYQLRVAVFHHPTLKIQQLCNFLTSECDDFLKNELPQSLMIRQLFTSSFEPLSDHSNPDINEYVGIIILYSSSSGETFTFAKDSLTFTDNLENTFRIVVQMDNSQKHMNVIGPEGERLAQKNDLLFIKLNLYNSDELVNNLNRNIYLMVENYYYPNEEERQRPSASYEVQASPSQFVLNYDDVEQKIIATSEEKQKVMQLIQKAAILRTSREQEIIAEQQAIDGSIQNVERVLNNINKHIKERLESDWFTSLKDSLYKPAEKQSRFFSKLKLTQQFIDEEKPKASRIPLFKSRQFHQSIHNSKYNYTLQQTIKRLDTSLIKLVIALENAESQGAQIMAELQVYENTNYQDLAFIALRKLGLRETERNFKLIKREIQNKIDTYVRQLSRNIKKLERQRTFQRSYIAVNKK